MSNPIRQIEETYYRIYDSLERTRRIDPLGQQALLLRRQLRTVRDWTIKCYAIEDKRNDQKNITRPR